jgi:hypothetical protein
LFQDAAQCTWSQIIPWVTGNGDATCFGWVLVLPVAASCCHQVPTIALDQLITSRTFIVARPGMLNQQVLTVTTHYTTPPDASE